MAVRRGGIDVKKLEHQEEQFKLENNEMNHKEQIWRRQQVIEAEKRMEFINIRMRTISFLENLILSSETDEVKKKLLSHIHHLQ